MELIIHRYLPLTTVEGPGKRFCLWVQGCSIQCKGCGVPWTWAKNNGRAISVDNLFLEILESKKKNNIEGVTFLGGEPFDQAKALGKLALKVKELGLTVMVFSGYLYEELKKNKENEDLLTSADLLIDGPFIKDKLDLSRPWVGSSNQRYHFLTPVYFNLKHQLTEIGNKIEVRISKDGLVSINGMATQQTLNDLFGKDRYKKLKNYEKQRGGY